MLQLEPMQNGTLPPDPYAPPRAAPGAPAFPLDGPEAKRRAYAGTERALGLFGAFFGSIGTLFGFIIVASVVFLGGVHGARATISLCLVTLTFILLAVGAFAVARLHGFGRACLTASVAIGVVHAFFGAVSGEPTRPSSALVWLVLWLLLLGWLWVGRPAVVLSPEYRAVIRATPHLDRKTSIVAWLALAVLLVLVFVAVWNFFAGGPTRH